MESSEPAGASMGSALVKQCNSFGANKQEKPPQSGRTVPLVSKRPGFKSFYYSEHMGLSTDFLISFMFSSSSMKWGN